jgi:hypothetical protein
VGSPDDSQKVLDEMVRGAKAGAAIVIHESTWRKKLSADEKACPECRRRDELAERYGTTPLEFDEWVAMLTKAGVAEIETEFVEWSRPEMFWKVRQERDVAHHSQVLTFPERLVTVYRIFKEYGVGGVRKVLENEKIFYKAILDGKLGYCLFKGEKRRTTRFLPRQNHERISI